VAYVERVTGGVALGQNNRSGGRDVSVMRTHPATSRFRGAGEPDVRVVPTGTPDVAVHTPTPASDPEVATAHIGGPFPQPRRTQPPAEVVMNEEGRAILNVPFGNTPLTAPIADAASNFFNSMGNRGSVVSSSNALGRAPSAFEGGTYRGNSGQTGFGGKFGESEAPGWRNFLRAFIAGRRFGGVL
jgi:hypothetical protein